MAIVTINDMRNLVIIFAISKCEFYNFEKKILNMLIYYYLFYFNFSIPVILV